MDNDDLLCTKYGFTMISSDGNVLPSITDYDKCSMLVIRDIRLMRNIPKEYVIGNNYDVPNLYNEILIGSERKHFLEYRGKCYIAVPDIDGSCPYFMDITNQVKTLQTQVITYIKKEE